MDTPGRAGLEPGGLPPHLGGAQWPQLLPALQDMLQVHRAQQQAELTQWLGLGPVPIAQHWHLQLSAQDLQTGV